MSHGILRDHSKYNVMWEDVFAPSEKEKTEVGKERAQALKFYSEAVFGQDAFPIVVALKYIFGLNEEQVQEVMLAIEEQVALEDNEPEEPTPEPTEE